MPALPPSPPVAAPPDPTTCRDCHTLVHLDAAGGWQSVDKGTYDCGRGTNEQHRPTS